MASTDAITTALRRKVAELSEGRLRPDAIDPSKPMLEYGYVDSLTAVMLLAHVEETWDVEIEETELLSTTKTLAALATAVQQRSG